MIRPMGLWALLMGLLVFSCESGPSLGDTGKPRGDTGEPLGEPSLSVPQGQELPGKITDAGETGEPVLTPPAGEPASDIPEYDLVEPSLILAESNPPETPPPEQTAAAVLPEPAASEPPPAVPAAPETPPAVSPPAPVVEVPPEPAGPAAPAEAFQDLPPSPPAPPPFIRPAEPEPPPPAAKTLVPVPANPPPELPARLPPNAPEEEIVYSRTVRATAGQLIEIPFRGTGWVYLGELNSRRGIDYDSRRLDPEGQSFVFRAEEAGTYGLKFYKQDFIRDYILNDHVRVVVGEAPDAFGAGWFNPPVDRERVIAEPRWPPLPGEERDVPEKNGPGTPGPGTSAAAEPEPRPVPEDPPEPGVPETGSGVQTAAVPPEKGGESPRAPGIPESGGGAGTGGAGTDGGAAFPPDSSPDEYLRGSREAYDAGQVGTALAILDQFRERFPSGSDEAWWLYGQAYESNGQYRDIRSALDYYRRLIREYPQSPRYDEARRRIAHLERYYFNIR